MTTLVTYHARQRFALRVNAVANPVLAIREMWLTGRDATPDDFSLFRVTPEPGAAYRVGAHSGLYCLLVKRDRRIVTVLTQ